MTNCRILEYYVIFIYFQAAVSALLAVSVLYVENEYYVTFKISYYEIRYFVELANRRMRNQGHKYHKIFLSHQDPWEISANVNNFIGLFASNSLTNTIRGGKSKG